jgi:hypothetical protein
VRAREASQSRHTRSAPSRACNFASTPPSSIAFRSRHPEIAAFTCDTACASAVIPVRGPLPFRARGSTYAAGAQDTTPLDQATWGASATLIQRHTNAPFPGRPRRTQFWRLVRPRRHLPRAASEGTGGLSSYTNFGSARPAVVTPLWPTSWRPDAGLSQLLTSVSEANINIPTMSSHRHHNYHQYHHHRYHRYHHYQHYHPHCFITPAAQPNPGENPIRKTLPSKGHIIHLASTCDEP